MEPQTENEAQKNRESETNARAVLVGLTHLDKSKYNGWDGRSGCWGCAIDVSVVSEALDHEGFSITPLIDGEASADNVLRELREAAAATDEGDTLFFYFSGHGSQTPDLDGDEIDGQDETLCCFDREIVDDELKAIWDTMGAGTVLYMMSDSCNSGTNFRVHAADGRDLGPIPIPVERQIPPSMGVGRESDQLRCDVLHIGGCRDGSVSMGEMTGGVFTKAITHAWAAGTGPQTWQELFDQASDVITTQIPRLNVDGPNGENLRYARPFSPIGGAEVRNLSTTESGQDPELDLRSDNDDIVAEAIRSGAIRPLDLETEQGAGRSMPISESQSRRVVRWLMENFGDELTAASEGTPFSPALLCAIVCQETAYFWLPLHDRLKNERRYQDFPDELTDLIVARCVLDASGDYPETSRSAFPQNTYRFREQYGAAFTSILINEANQTRALRGFSPRDWVYKGYGIFQYDLQFVIGDEDFFRDREWHQFGNCLDKCMHELTSIHRRTNELWETVYRYNGRGPRARRYRDNVRLYSRWCQDEIDKMREKGRRNLSSNDSRSRSRRRIIPRSAPKLKQKKLRQHMANLNLEIDREKYPLVIVGIRGYYLDSMGRPRKNDRGLYDDAIFIDSEYDFASFNGNTDPSRVRKGSGYGSGKGMASLNTGIWYSYKFDTHNGSSSHPAICQRLGKVTVTRDGINGDYTHTGMFGINIHRGGYSGTSSLGCQTIHPDHWNAFYSFGKTLAKRYFNENWNKVVIPYVLIDETEIRQAGRQRDMT